MMRKLACIFLIILSSCSENVLRNKYFKTPSAEAVRKIQQDANLKIDTILIDDSYELYVRQICRDAPTAGFYSSANPKPAGSVNMCNCEDLAGPRNKKERLEIEYVLYSGSKRNFIYITTIPPGMVKMGTSFVSLYDQPLFDLDSLVNVNYFNTFFFGKVTGDIISIKKSKSDTSRWKMNLSTDKRSLTIDHLDYRDGKDIYSTDLANDLSFPVKFYHKKNWEMILNDCAEDDEIIETHNNTLEKKVIYIYSDKRHTDEADKVWFHFNTSYSWPGYADRYDLYFQSGRIKSSPFILF